MAMTDALDALDDFYLLLGCSCLSCSTCWDNLRENAPGLCPDCRLHRLYTRQDRWRAQEHYEQQIAAIKLAGRGERLRRATMGA